MLVVGVFVVLAPVLVCVFAVVVGVLDVDALVAVLAVLAVLVVAGGVDAPVVLLACLEAPQPPIANAAINTPES